MWLNLSNINISARVENFEDYDENGDYDEKQTRKITESIEKDIEEGLTKLFDKIQKKYSCDVYHELQ